MVFKLVRTDTEEPRKIQLPRGTHLIGRGKLLDCDDKRVSRNHGELEVVDDSVTIKALHQNPCFYIKKESDQTQILKRGNIASLYNGDKFGLLPDSFWYEVLHCSDIDGAQTPELAGDTGDEINETPYETNEIPNETNEIPNETNGIDTQVTQMDFDPNETCEDRAESPSLIGKENESPSMLQGGIESPSLTPKPEPPEEAGSPSVLDNPAANENNQNDGTESLSKRSHSPDSPEAKRVKTEPMDEDTSDQVTVKQEPDATPGPSNDQGSASNADSSKKDLPPSPTKPTAPVRERCMYGASCYRKNPVHFAQFAHPSDPDWGSGSRGRCPYGAMCRKRDPRHWRDHDHPPGVQRPSDPPQGMRVVERRGNIFYINAHTVNFYDDHFEVHDSDGDSVDFDYEF